VSRNAYRILEKLPAGRDRGRWNKSLRWMLCCKLVVNLEDWRCRIFICHVGVVCYSNLKRAITGKRGGVVTNWTLSTAPLPKKKEPLHLFLSMRCYEAEKDHVFFFDKVGQDCRLLEEIITRTSHSDTDYGHLNEQINPNIINM
jgi:hypothetical protein